MRVGRVPGAYPSHWTVYIRDGHTSLRTGPLQSNETAYTYSLLTGPLQPRRGTMLTVE